MKRDGFVYSLYLKNIRNLAIVTVLVLAFYFWELSGCVLYLQNYLFPTTTIDWDGVAAMGSLDLGETTGERPAGDDAAPSMFFLEWVYQEGDHYRFRFPIDQVTETGIYYDDLNVAYYNCADIDDFYSRLPNEDYGVFRLVLVEAGGQTFVAALPYEDTLTAGETIDAVFAPMADTSTMVYDLARNGNTETVNIDYIDLRDTPVDYEDEDFKDMCLYTPIALALTVLTLLFLIRPHWHPTYAQLAKYGRTIDQVVESVDEEYTRVGVSTNPYEKKTLYLETWLVKRSMFMNAIQKNHKFKN
jgi:hypothetical protein